MPDIRAGQVSLELPQDFGTIKRVLVQRRGARPYQLIQVPTGTRKGESQGGEPGLPTHYQLVSPKILHLSPTPNEDCRLIVEYLIEKIF